MTFFRGIDLYFDGHGHCRPLLLEDAGKQNENLKGFKDWNLPHNQERLINVRAWPFFQNEIYISFLRISLNMLKKFCQE
jgi:hypothetical protein